MKLIPPFIKDFLQETLNRIFIRKPFYFIVWQRIGAIMMAISGIPYVLKQFDIVLSEPFSSMSNKVVSWVGLGLFIWSQLTVSTPPVAQTQDGEPIKVTDPKQMPLTSKAEQKDMKETKPPPPVSDDVPSPDNKP